MKIKPNTALQMKDHYLQYYRQHDNYKLEEMAIKDRGYEFAKSIKFIFDRRTSDLIITGDYGYAIFSWYSNQNSLETIHEYIENDYNYFATKCVTSSRPLYIFSHEQAKKDIEEWLEDCSFKSSLLDDLGIFDMYTKEDIIRRLIGCIDEYKGFDLRNDIYDAGDDIEKVLEFIDDDWQESALFWGKTLSEIVPLWVHALDLGFRWKKQQERKDKNGRT